MRVVVERSAPVPPIRYIRVELSVAEAEEMLRERQRCSWRDGGNVSHSGLPITMHELFDRIDAEMRIPQGGSFSHQESGL